MDSDPSPPANVSAIPCLFTVEKFQQAPSQEIDREPTNVYLVRPTAIWDSVERIKEVVIEDEHYRLHDIIAVARHDLPQSPIWSAHILEIRAHKTSGQVFIRVFWFYEPSQLPASLRHPYHGRRELIASNSMAVINATAVASRAHVSHWHEEHEPVPAAGLFWRQTYDEQAQRLGPLYDPCPYPCIMHQNPDEALISCPLPGCDARMHKSCILDATLSRLQAEAEAQAEPEAVLSKNGKKKVKKVKKLPSLEAEWMDERSEGYGALITEGPIPLSQQ
ncbi:MAG: hypothetical protein ASARMPREDX12_002606 [Alectoria sarmentosa]|nr:MAG: hypothetical protein ASARMPREDX12_002606 [Alectoria sarmentosa]CAD6568767.1 MAG: hypothetical protein ASARMPRED_002043 [Alectoria sarmentosa]